MNSLERFGSLTSTPLGILELVTTLIVGLCIVAIFIAILIDFAEAGGRKTKRAKRSIVATGRMTLFFVAFYLLLRFRIGVFGEVDLTIRVPLLVVGLLLMVVGCVVNILGRLRLGRNWANHIKIYDDHELVTAGVYGVVRHPLYASLIWMFFAASLIYLNWAAFLANLLVFIPFMYYRARQEEELLMERFPSYVDYRRRVGMFFPRPGGRR